MASPRPHQPGRLLGPAGAGVWHRIAAAVADPGVDDVLFVARCTQNQIRFDPRFDLIVLLSASAEVLAERLASGTSRSLQASHPVSLERVLDDRRAVERWNAAADHEIRAANPLSDVVTEVLHLAGAWPRGSCYAGLAIRFALARRRR